MMEEWEKFINYSDFIIPPEFFKENTGLENIITLNNFLEEPSPNNFIKPLEISPNNFVKPLEISHNNFIELLEISPDNFIEPPEISPDNFIEPPEISPNNFVGPLEISPNSFLEEPIEETFNNNSNTLNYQYNLCVGDTFDNWTFVDKFMHNYCLERGFGYQIF
jgi:hypothetical protein